MNAPLMGRVLVESLIGLGMTDVVLAPGSRNAPISLALFDADAAGRLRLHVRVDERVAAFTALGMAKASGAPVAVVTTSGTATANLSPAAMEARASGVPLLLVTADRPAEMVGTGANQTGHQLGILGPSALEVVRLSSCSGEPHHWAAALTRAHTVASGARTRQPGPVQVNVELAAPLVGQVPQPSVDVPEVHTSQPAEQVLQLPVGPRTVVLAGDAPPAVGAEARALAELASLPLLAEPSSNARTGRCVVPRYRELLQTELGARIERVIVFGHPTLSRPVTRLLSRDDIEVVVVAGTAQWHDLGATASAVVDRVQIDAGDPAWLAAWTSHTTPGEHEWDARAAVHATLAAMGGEGALFIGASDVIRHADLAPAPTHTAAPDVYANRGLAGIDGTISTAAGVSLALGRPVTVVLGDLTFQHDLGGLVVPPQEPQPELRIVVIDNGGGAIFSSLEQGAPEYQAAFDRVFGTPQHVDIVALARAAGWEAETVASAEALTHALARPGNRVVVASV